MAELWYNKKHARLSWVLSHLRRLEVKNTERLLQLESGYKAVKISICGLTDKQQILKSSEPKPGTEFVPFRAGCPRFYFHTKMTYQLVGCLFVTSRTQEAIMAVNFLL
ncbi:hypothetical protein K2173_001874 [Erythroxylum novogranatense]|uniref:Uncharacterized protein n=1 Tax=Erythroxylum novogranatense TaxID=1862640 RepID=A0AAV8SPN9_9ROSI|nr:hypothetical protein K2173_001874 [Erythroxylum novogranatense]